MIIKTLKLHDKNLVEEVYQLGRQVIDYFNKIFVMQF